MGTKEIMDNNPFLVSPTDYKSTTSIKNTLNDDGLLPSDDGINPFMSQSSSNKNPFIIETKHDWGTTDARDAGKTNSGMSAPERTGTSFERMKMAAQEGFVTSPITGRNEGRTQLIQAQNLMSKMERNPWLTTPENIKEVERLQKDAIGRLQNYIVMRKGIQADMADLNPSFAEKLAGGGAAMVGDPINWYGPGGGTLLKTMAKGFGYGVFSGFTRAMEQGQYDKALDLIKDDPTIKELLESGIHSGALLAALSGMMHVVGHTGTKSNVKPSDDVIKTDAKNFVENLPNVDPEKGIDTSGVKGPYFNPDGEVPPDGTRLLRKNDLTPTNVKTANIYNDLMATQGKEQVPGVSELGEKITNEKDLNRPYWPDQDLQDAIRDANIEQGDQGPNPYIPQDKLAEAQRWADKGQPAFGQMEIPQEAGNVPVWPDPALQKAMGQANRRANAIDNLPNTAEVELGGKSPYMSMEELGKAQDQVGRTGEPAHSEMEIPAEMGNQPYWRNKELEKAKAMAARTAETRVGGPIDLADAKGLSSKAVDRRIEDLKQNAKLAQELTESKTVSEAVTTVLKYIKDPDQKAVGEILQKYIDKNVKFFALNPEHVDKLSVDSPARGLDKAIGLHSTYEDGHHNVAVRGINYFLDKRLSDGLNPEVILHETTHSITDHAFYIASDPRLVDNPKYANHVAFARDMFDLMKTVAHEMPIKMLDHFNQAFENAAEFNAYGWTSPEFRKALAEVELKTYGKSAWQQFKDNVKSFFGKEIETKNALTELDKFLDRLDDLQKEEVDRKEIGSAVKRLMDNGLENTSYIKDHIDEIKDIKWWGKILPVTENQREKILGNPLISAVYNKVREYQSLGDSRLNHYKTYLDGLNDMMVKHRKDALQMFKVLADIQDPSLKEQRQFAQDTNTREQFLASQGMPESQIPMAMKVLNVLQHLGKTDQDNAVAAFGHNWHLEPMYFPREHTGAFTVSVVDAAGTPVYMRGFEDSALAHKYKEAMAKELQGTDHQVALERNQTGSLAEVYTMLRMSDSKIPDFLKGINDKLLKELEVAKRKFEMERSAEKVAGYTGETIYGENATGAFKRSDDKLLTLLQRRMEQSYRLEVNAKLLKELKEPLIDSGALANHPNLENYIHQFLARELGISISKFHAAGKGVDFIVDNIGKHVDAFMGEMKGYEGGDVSYFRPNAVARLAQAYTGLMSMFKLALSPSTITANTSTWFMVPLEGFRVASKEGVDQSVALAAMFKHYVSEHDRSFQDFMKEAKLEQMVDPNVSDPMIIARTKEANRIARAINAPRDFVELQTNKAALSYFYQYYKLTKPELDVTSREFKQLVYDATRSWTGDYTSAATPMFISQGGEAGRLMSNFAKWKFNQLGRLFDDIKDMKQGNVVPFMYTFLMTTFLAGAAGAPIIAEYEAIRRIGMKLGWFDIPPLSGAMYQVKSKIEKEYGKKWAKVADMAIRSPVTVGMDEGFKALGLESGPDLSTNLRFSSALEVNTLPVQFATDFWNALSTSAKQIAKPLGLGHGASAQEVKEALHFLPTGPGNVVEELYKNYLASGHATKGIETPSGKTRYIDQFSSKDQGMYVQSPEEKAMAFAGMKSAKQNEYTDKLYYKEWSERYEKKQMTTLTNQFIENLHDPEQTKEIAKEMAAIKGETGLKHLEQEVQKRIVERKTSYFEREAIKEVNNPDVFNATKALKMLREMRPSK